MNLTNEQRNEKPIRVGWVRYVDGLEQTYGNDRFRAKFIVTNDVLYF